MGYKQNESPARSLHRPELEAEGGSQLSQGGSCAGGLRLQLHEVVRRLAGCRFPRVSQRRKRHIESAAEKPAHDRQEVHREGTIRYVPSQEVLVPDRARHTCRRGSRLYKLAKDGVLASVWYLSF